MGMEIDEADLLSQLADPSEEKRYKALVYLRDERVQLSPQLSEALNALEADTSRPVRQLSRDLLAGRYPSKPLDVGKEIPTPLPDIPTSDPPILLLALISMGSGATGLMVSALSLVNYYTLGRFPFPDPLDVLLYVNLVLTFPYVLMGVWLLFPGRLQKVVARGFSFVSLALSLLMIVGLQPAYERYWAFQFTEADQARFISFLEPFQVAMMMLPVIAGQLLQLYFLTQYLVLQSRPSHRTSSPSSPTASDRGKEEDAETDSSPTGEAPSIDNTERDR